MKLTISILTAALLFVCNLSAQFVAGPNIKAAITNLPVQIYGSNGATAYVPWSTYGTAPSVAIGKDGFGVTINAAGTNAALTTNVFFLLATSGDGVNFATNNLITIAYIPPGTGYRPQYTNIANTVANVGNATFVRLYTVLQTNGVDGSSLAGSLFVTNFNISTR